MLPWLWYWAPQFHLPFGGDVAQRIEPQTHWFFDGIAPRSGNGDIERQVFDTASYGRQLGWIVEVLLAQAGSGGVSEAQGQESLKRLENVHRQAEVIKRRHRDDAAQAAADALERLRQADPQAFTQLLERAAAAVPAPPKALRASRKALR